MGTSKQNSLSDWRMGNASRTLPAPMEATKMRSHHSNTPQHDPQRGILFSQNDSKAVWPFIFISCITTITIVGFVCMCCVFVCCSLSRSLSHSLPPPSPPTSPHPNTHTPHYASNSLMSSPADNCLNSSLILAVLIGVSL